MLPLTSPTLTSCVFRPLSAVEVVDKVEPSVDVGLKLVGSAEIEVGSWARITPARNAAPNP